MKKIILLAIAVIVAGTSFAQKDNIFDIHHDWDKMIGYSYQPGYPYGFTLAGGSFMTFGFSDGETVYREASTEYFKPTWSLRFGWIGYSFDEDVTGWGAITFRPFVNMGMNFMKQYTKTGINWDSDTKTYFTFAPSLAVNVYMVNFFVGYEIVPHFKELNGLNFGAGFSIPISKPEAKDPKKIMSKTVSL